MEMWIIKDFIKAMCVFAGFPIDAEIIPDSFSVNQYYNTSTQRIKYCIDFEVILDREMH